MSLIVSQRSNQKANRFQSQKIEKLMIDLLLISYKRSNLQNIPFLNRQFTADFKATGWSVPQRIERSICVVPKKGNAVVISEAMHAVP